MTSQFWQGAFCYKFEIIFQKGINPQGFGTVGMLLNFIITLILTPFLQALDKKAQNMVDSVREPEGVGPAIEIETAPEH